jgi:hypothetical protein
VKTLNGVNHLSCFNVYDFDGVIAKGGYERKVVYGIISDMIHPSMDIGQWYLRVELHVIRSNNFMSGG